MTTALTSTVLTRPLLEPLGPGPDGRPLFRVDRGFQYRSRLLGGIVEIPGGGCHAWVTDLASVPRWLPATWFLAGGFGTVPALLHDFAYLWHSVPMIVPATFTRGLRRATADALFYECMQAERDPPEAWRQWVIWSGVRVGGRSAWARQVKRPRA